MKSSPPHTALAFVLHKPATLLLTLTLADRYCDRWTQPLDTTVGHAQVQNFLATALCACRTGVSLPDSALGDVGMSALQAVVAAVGRSTAAFVVPAYDSLTVPTRVYSLNLSSNRCVAVL
jgi:hypothetical protein